MTPLILKILTMYKISTILANILLHEVFSPRYTEDAFGQCVSMPVLEMLKNQMKDIGIFFHREQQDFQ
ncbi:hypothetical protein SDC9_164761 [bioreactor metagenome]|uniref:Uncharacterized protein n=1 Tax=bioreactor metagenome TaxID=1076179 RepID=A0A645FSH3_9ZZZZ